MVALSSTASKLSSGKSMAITLPFSPADTPPHPHTQRRRHPQVILLPCLWPVLVAPYAHVSSSKSAYSSAMSSTTTPLKSMFVTRE